MPISTAIIGAGFSARTFHEPFLRRNAAFNLVAASGRQAAIFRDHWPDMVCFDHADALLERCDAQLVIICSPNAVHAELACKALAQGRVVLVDKPMCCSLAEAEQLLSAEAGSDGRLCVFHNRRHDGDFLTVKRLLSAQMLGTVRRFESHFDRARPQPQDRWRERPGEGTGIWFDLGPHLIDQALCLFAEPDTITARIRTIRPGAQVDDCFDVLLDYGGLNVRLVSSPLAWGPPLRFDIQGDAGRFIKHWLDPQEDRLRTDSAFGDADWSREPAERFGRLEKADGSGLIATEAGDHAGFFAALAKAILSQEPLPVPAAEGLAVIRLLELGRQSSDQGRTLSV